MDDDIQSQGYSLDTKEKEIIKEGEKHSLITRRLSYPCRPTVVGRYHQLRHRKKTYFIGLKINH